MENENEKVAVDISCPRRGCNGEIMFADAGEIYDGEIAHCDTCGRAAVSVEYIDGSIRVQAYDGV